MTAHPAVAVSRPPAALYGVALARVRAAGLLRRRPGPYLVLWAGTMGVLAVTVAALVRWQDSWWLLMAAPVLAVVSAQIGFLGHDIAHRQVSHDRRVCLVLGLVHANLLSGLSYGWWMAKHNAHHAHPNDLESDPDVRPGVLAFDVSHAVTRRGTQAFVTRNQAWLFFPMLLLESANLYVAGIRALARPGIRHRAVELSLIGLHTVLYLSLLAMTMTWVQALAFVAIHQGLRGLYLGLSFAPNHKGMPVLSGAEQADPFLRQVLTSRNVRGGVVTDLALGGLNYQIEHHLFPSMPRANLGRAQAIVKDLCAEHEVPYLETSLFASYAEVIRHLHAVGAPLRTA
ncbi:acyl-CoA desaturase [Nostocoides sp. HKS02]|uniref:fatty acid desaturase family protein n=1 Tax=Nostocoides sp. HKS02 TaxID=1813880 RepID=UPI001E315E25|nr:acyl-CoA desaturase [Tetrasphaera sp. HKS02]